MRLIDADALSEHKFQEVEFHGGSLNAAYRQGWNDAIDAIVDNEPPVDAEQVVRCRDCKHHDGIRCFRWNSTIITGFDDFCSNGERKDGNGDGDETD